MTTCLRQGVHWFTVVEIHSLRSDGHIGLISGEARGWQWWSMCGEGMASQEWLRVTEPNSAFILNRVTRTVLQEHSPVTQGATSYPTTLVL